MAIAQSSSQHCFPLNFTVGETVADISIMVDTSSAMSAVQFDMMKSSLRNWSQSYSLGPGDKQVQFGFIGYSQIAISYGFFQDIISQATFDTVLGGVLQWDSTTRNAYSGFAKALDNLVYSDLGSGARRCVPHVLVVFSGDVYTLTRPEILTTVQRQYETVLAIGMTPNSINTQVDQLTAATGTAENVYFLDGSVNLKYIVPWLVKRVGLAPRPTEGC